MFQPIFWIDWLMPRWCNRFDRCTAAENRGRAYLLVDVVASVAPLTLWETAARPLAAALVRLVDGHRLF